MARITTQVYESPSSEGRIKPKYPLWDIYLPDCCMIAGDGLDWGYRDGLLERHPELGDTVVSEFTANLDESDDEGDVARQWAAKKLKKLPEYAIATINSFLSGYRDKIIFDLETVSDTTGWMSVQISGEDENTLSLKGYLDYTEGETQSSSCRYSKVDFFQKHVSKGHECLVDMVNGVVKLFKGVDVETVRVFMLGDIWVDFSVAENFDRYDYFMAIDENRTDGMYSVCLFMAPKEENDGPVVVKIPKYYSEAIRCLEEEEEEEFEMEFYPDGFTVSVSDSPEAIRLRDLEYIRGK